VCCTVLHWVDVLQRLSDLHCVAECCSVLQCVLYRVAERVAVTYSDLQCVWQCVAVCCSVLHCTAVWCGVLQCIVV